MKKTIIALIVVFLAVSLLQTAFLHGKLPVQAWFAGDSVTVISSAEDRTILIHKDGQATPLQIRGVLMDSCLPGHYSNDFSVEQDTYYSWMEQTAQMGANTISVYSMMDSDFYNALYEYNMSHEIPLYLLQGVTAPDYNMNNAKDGFEGFYEKLLSDARDTVDAVHGNLIVTLGRVQSSGNYIRDLSEWTIGYMIGTEWVPYTMDYTDHKIGNPTSYTGEYFCTAPDATSSEVLFAMLMDEITGYEMRRYRHQRLIGFSNSTGTDPLTYNEDVRMQLEKNVRINASHVLPTEKALAGCFSGYYLRGEMKDFMACLDSRDWQDYGDTLIGINPETVYGGYVHFLTQLHRMPVVVSYGFSSSRVSDKPEEPLTEQEQGEALVAYYEDFMEAGCQGTVIANWQDNWSRTTWHTMFAVDEESEQNWFDVQTVNNCFGLLAFDPGKEGTVCIVDGSAEEWTEEDTVIAAGERRLSVRYDLAYLYLMISGADIREPMVIPIDVTPNSGSTSIEGRNVRFEQFADFALELAGEEDSRLLVQQRYDAAYMAFEKKISGQNAFYAVPDPYTNRFGPIRNVLRKPLDPNAGLREMEIEERAIFNRYGVRETGQLRHGNADPASPDYDSLADFCYGTNCVEIRIPWQLLNFSNPSEMKIHDDYYQYYGVEEMKIEEISLGLGSQDRAALIPMEPLELSGWNERVEYHERLKQSYYVVQDAWTGR